MRRTLQTLNLQALTLSSRENKTIKLPARFCRFAPAKKQLND